MFTSYFANLKNVSNPLAICGKSPVWYTGPEFKTLAPKYGFFKDYKDGKIDDTEYVIQYYKQILDKLNPQKVYDHLINTYGENVTLLCYEKLGDFCHRHIVAVWFQTELGIIINEK